MHNMKLSSLFIIALTATGFTVAAKTSTLTIKSITDCFVNLNLADGAGSNAALSDGLSAEIAQARAASFPYVTAASSIKGKVLSVGTDFYYCAKFQITTDAAAPVVTIEGITDKFKIKELYFRY